MTEPVDPTIQEIVEDSLERSTDTIPQSTEGGVVESVKTAVIFALRESFSGTSFSGKHGAPAHISMEYPKILTEYPGIWVQFSFTELKRAGIAHEVLLNEGTSEEPNWSPLQEWRFSGRVQMTISALTSLERDRIVDSILSMMAFARGPETWLTDPERDTQQNRAFISALAANPFVMMAVNTDVLVSGGESASPNVLPWDPNQLVYENTLSFDMTGEFNIIFRHDGTYTLRRIDVIPERKALTDWY